MLCDSEFRQLLDYFDRPWSGYRKVRKGVKKRIRRHMKGLGISTVRQYILILERQPEERTIFEGCLRVTISRFFRDRFLWSYLEEQVVPELTDSFPDRLNIWSAGCANGEEPYSLAITLDVMQKGMMSSILATDANNVSLNRARQGIYNRSSLKEVSEELRRRYFVKDPAKGEFCIRSFLKKGIVWQNHDLLSHPPNGPFHLILLRNNLLTYHQGAALQVTLKGIVESLVPGGYLIFGSHEQLQERDVPLISEKQCPYVYRLRKGA